MRTYILAIALLAACTSSTSESNPQEEDADGDGWPGATDCDDDDPLINPSAREVCDLLGVDEDCDNGANDADPEGPTDATDWYPDADGDGFAPDGGTPISACDAPAGHASATGDCDDGAPSVNPGAPELCDAAAVDEDCDGASDDADPSTEPGSFGLWYPDADGDGYGDSAASAARCIQPEGYVAEPGDCDDGDEDVSPDAAEWCDDNDRDENCDGAADDEDDDPLGTLIYYADSDGDGYGGDRDIEACDPPDGYAERGGDCDDSRRDVSPLGTEVCDDAGADEDCDTTVNDADPSVTGTTLWYGDNDGDGYGGTGVTAACEAPADHYALNDDCDDNDPDIHPGGQEVCDDGDVDEDCDGLVEDADGSAIGQTTWYQDLDGDEWGTTAATLDRCDEPAAYAAAEGDCDDAESGVSPDALEVCGDSVDQDCDGEDPDCPYAGSGDPETDYDFKPYGLSSGSEFGTRLAAGDFDGDGEGDLVISAPSATYRSSGYGVVYGYTGPFPSGAQSATTSDAFLYYNWEADHAGSYGNMLENIGDLDGDGADDLLIGGNDQMAWLHYGGTGAATSSAVADGEFTCGSAAAAGDLTAAAGDDDWLCGNPEFDLIDANLGIAYIYEGTTWAASFMGENANDEAGHSVASGDADGDGLNDLWIGAPGADTGFGGAGAVYLFYGPPPLGALTDLSTADAKIIGAATSNMLGYRATMPGDMDGDGLDDLLTSAPLASGTGAYEGKVYLFTSVPAGTSSVTTTAAVTFVGENDNLLLGTSSFAGGDVDGDGDGDLLFGAATDSDGGSAAGAVWLVYGPHSGSISLTSADASWRGDDASDYLGTDVALVPDTDGDGDFEIAMGASNGDHGAATARGAAWVLDGR